MSEHSSHSSEHPVLMILDGEQMGQRWAIQHESYVVGRGGECDLVLPERQVSREHIRIYYEDERYFLQDLGSKNGTWVNETQIENETIQLRDGDEINIAMAVTMIFVGSESTVPVLLEQIRRQKGRLSLDRESRRVFIVEVEIDPPLSLPQYRLLELLYDAEGAVCTRDEVVQAVWPEAMGEGVSEQAIDALVRRLRDRLNEIDPEHQYVVTVRGHGFRLDNPKE